MQKMRWTNVLAALSLPFVLAGCASSSSAKLLDAYRAPGTVSIVFEKIAVLVLNGDRDLRSSLEAQVVASAKQRNRLFAAHAALGTDMPSVEVIKQKLAEQNFDGVIALRMIRATEVNTSASDPGVTFSSYASSVPPGEAPFGEGRVRVEASIYRLSDEHLVWRGIVEASGSNSPSELVADAVLVIRDELRDTGLVHD
jgi:hypothetical protein